MKKLWRYKLFIFLFSLAIIGVNLVPRCVEVYRYKLNAEVSFVNDDLRGALLSYKSKVDKIDSARYACAQHKLLDLSNKGTSNFRENS